MNYRHIKTSIGYLSVEKYWDEREQDTHEGGKRKPPDEKYPFWQIVHTGWDSKRERLKTKYKTRELAAKAVHDHDIGMVAWDSLRDEKVPGNISDWEEGKPPPK